MKISGPDGCEGLGKGDRVQTGREDGSTPLLLLLAPPQSLAFSVAPSYSELSRAAWLDQGEADSSVRSSGTFWQCFWRGNLFPGSSVTDLMTEALRGQSSSYTHF